jgi:hypothetical protein
MATLLGRQFDIGIGKETSRGTVVVADFWEKQVEVDIDDKFDSVVIDTALGQIEDSEDAVIARKWSEGSIRAHAKSESIGLWLLSVMGTDTPATVESGVYDHVLTVAQTNTHQSLTISTNDAIQDYRFANCAVQSFELIVEAGKLVDYKAKFIGRNGATATNSVSFSSSEKLFTASMAVFKHATTSGGLAGATATKIHKLNLKVDTNIEPEYVLGSITPNDLLNKQFSVSGEIELYFKDEAEFKTAALASTSNAMQLVITDTNLIGAASYSTITIIIYKYKIQELSRDLSPDGIITQKVQFKGMYSSSDSKMLQITVRNVTATY